MTGARGSAVQPAQPAFASAPARGPLWAWVLVSLGLVGVIAWLRLVVFPDRFVPLTSALTLLVCLVHRDLRLLWGMTIVFVAMVLYKAAVLVPGSGAQGQGHWIFAAMQMSNTVIAAVVIHAVIRLTGRLEGTVGLLERSNAELEASNEELAAREEEITQQNEELQSQAEELEQQAEELNSQTEELQGLNEQLVARERAMGDLLSTTSMGAQQPEAATKLGELIQRLIGGRAAGGAILEASGSDMSIYPLAGIAPRQQLKRDRTLAGLILGRKCSGCLADLSLRPDLEVPTLASGSPVRSLAAAPFAIAGELTGVLEIYSAEPGDWSEHELRVVQWLADQCGLMWTAARLAREREQLLESERSARTDADRANRMKDEFVATLSHELRTPLNAILGWATLLKKEGAADAEELVKGLDVIERNARLQSQLISDLLDISSIMAGKIRLDAQAVDLPQVVERARDSVRLAAEARGVRLEADYDPIDRIVVGDADRLQQVVLNLLTNAIKFTPKGGSVRIRVARLASFVQIAVIDDGEGVDPELLPHLFNRYRQGDGSYKRRHGGLGLGLAIARHLVELHGGTIEARSDGPGRGATFAVLLPVRAVDPAPPHRSEALSDLPEPPGLGGLSILVVDDQSDARELVARILRDHEATVQTAGSAAEALAVIEAGPPDVLVSDIGLPEMDGYALLRAVRDRGAEARKLPAIALTAFARSEDRTRALLAGFQAHLAKPVEAAELVATVASFRHDRPMAPAAQLDSPGVKGMSRADPPST